MDSDETLLAAVAAGRQDALRVLYDRHAAAILRLVRRMTSDAGVAEEILQEAWLAVWRSAGSFRGESSARGWLYGVAKRQAHNRLRKPVLPVVEIDAAHDVADPAADVEDEVLAGVAREDLAAGIRDLPAHLRDVLLLVLVDDLTYPEVATALDIPVGTVKSRMSHARKRLAQSLAASAANPGERPGGKL